ncbi:tetratricopeptide repeat protein [Stigmatella sp. ncwal1]|uniref:Tetratricopeptide repeat protein n=1 Tax=Stigmatella ashevillensis TaxID=2995309 RepID=A0ABT5DBH0_9BACT|nr:CHAT domain-containing protein [Stigmatella ashevillena]MDC0711014.1 tetratricopeptide repeat protein [Stigmatella ashevillena]
MRQTFGWMMAVFFCCTAGGWAREEKPDVRLIEAQSHFDEATKLKDAGKYSEALTQAERALSLKESVLGSTHLDVSICLNLLGDTYRLKGALAHAEPLLQRALDIREASLGKSHPDVASSLNSLAILYSTQGLYDRAEPLFQRALDIREASLGKSHPDVASSLNGLAILYKNQGSYARAEPFYQRALDIQEAFFGKNHPLVASALNNLANLYSTQGLSDKAKPLFQRALDIREVSLGKNHPDVATSLHNLANLYSAQGLYDQAEPLFQRALDIRETSLGKNHPLVASSLKNLGSLYSAQGLYGKAEPLYKRALDIYEASLGKNHPDVAQSLNVLAALYYAQGSYGQAEPLFQRALNIQEVSLGENHPLVAPTLNNLAILYFAQGLYSRAEPLYQRALDIQETSLGKTHPDVAASLNNLALLYFDQGRYGRAESLYQRALDIRETSLGKTHPLTASSLNNLAVLYKTQGLYGRAEPLYQQALSIQEASLGKTHPDVATSLLNLANIYYEQGLYDRAEPLHQRALAIKEATLGKTHPDVASSLHNLANIYFKQGLYGRAEPLYQRALAIKEASLGKTHPNVASSLHNLAALYFAQGLYGRAEFLFRRARSIWEASFDNNHPLLAESLNELGRLRLAQHRLSDALPLLSRSFSISERRLRHEALDFSESRLSSFLSLLRADEQRLYALLHAHPQDARVQRLALSASLLLKGRSSAEAAHISRTLYLNLSPADRDSFERLRGLRTQLASLSFSGPGSLPSDAYQQRLQALTEEGDSLEVELAKRSAPLRSLTALPSPDDIVSSVASSLPKDSALVEFITYNHNPLVSKPGTPPAKIVSNLRYFALVLFPDASIHSVDLGPASPIDQASSRLRDALAEKDASFQSTAQELYRRAFLPLLPLLGSTRRLFLSLDGQLNLIPFAALHDGQSFLLDSFDFSYLTSGRERLPHSQDTVPASSIFVLADPDFSSPFTSASSTSSPPVGSLERFFSLPHSDLPRSAWVPLPGTRLEAQAIQRLLPQAQLFLGSDASKQRLLSIPTPGILHLATHGFFLGNSPSSPSSRGLAFVDSLGNSPPPQHEPLLNSGLVLSGALASASTPSSEATLVTALELAGLNLWGTQLVVLSACDTGRGEVHLGQGVYGLRRSLMAAGAETVLVSLWKVNDDSTRLLMNLYYRNLLAGMGRASALRKAMLSLRSTHSHPHAWAPFIALGSDAPLRSITPIPPQAPKPKASTD